METLKSKRHPLTESVTVSLFELSLTAKNRSKCFEIAPNRILYGCDRTVASVSFHPVKIGRKGIFGHVQYIFWLVQSLQNAPLFNQPREAQTWNSSNVLHEQDFQFV